MARLISRAEAWEKAYEAFNQINFTAFDYFTIKQSIIDYIKLYFPESFNDFIESSEFVAIIEVFAYVGELLIYRVDVSSHENFMPVAQRKQSVLRLAKLISYKATRNLPARGLLKITSVNTTEDLYDTRGNPLQGVDVVWNDTNNSLWKEQFLTIMNGVTISNIGTVAPTERVQVDNVLFELYSLNNVYQNQGVIGYNINVNGSSYDMEIVPVQIDQFGPSERRPETNSKFTILYGADGFGNDSPTTGFFMFTKQGSITSIRRTFDGKTPNQFLDLPDTNINDTDLWINQVDPITGAILNDGSSKGRRSGEWEEVDTTSAQNVIFSYTNGRNRFETETLENDQVRIAFGDGEFTTIPSGAFDIWYRTSANQDLTIPQNAVVNKSFSIPYLDKLGQPQTLQFTASLISNVQNAAASEDIEHIRGVAPTTYYSQNRMVSGADYNLFPLKDPSILKVRTINRTYVGESKFAHWHDASDTYENVKIAGDDLIVTFENVPEITEIATPVSPAKLFMNTIAPILSTIGYYTFMVIEKIPTIRKSFTQGEAEQIQETLTKNVWPDPVWIVYDRKNDVFTATTVRPGGFIMRVDARVSGGQIIGWTVTSQATKMVIESPSTNFWSVNSNSVVAYDTLKAELDKVIILRANANKYRSGLLSENITLIPNKVEYETSTGLQNVRRMQVIAYDSTKSYLSGATLVSEILDPEYLLPEIEAVPATVSLPFSYIKGMKDFMVEGLEPGEWEEDPSVQTGGITTKIIVRKVVPEGAVKITQWSFVYFHRDSFSSKYQLVERDDVVRMEYSAERMAGLAASVSTYRRARGISKLNFMWLHTTPTFNLVDPSKTNINDVFVVQKGYYSNLLNWLSGIGSEPVLPSPLQLRNDYKELLDHAMISDTVVFHPGRFKVLFGSKAIAQLQAQLLVVKKTTTLLTDSQIKLRVRDITRDFFDINSWEFGETFYFTELAAVIHRELAADINSVVLVPIYPSHYFGSGFQVNMSEDEIAQVDIDIEDIDITTSLNATNMNQYR